MQGHVTANRLLLAATATLLLAPLCAGCGESEPRGKPGQNLASEATGPGPRDLLARLTTRLVEGRALSDESWGLDVDHLRRLLWPEAAAGGGAAALAHVSASHVAGDVARELAKAPDARAGLAERDAASLAIH